MPDLSPIGNEATAMSYAELVARLRNGVPVHDPDGRGAIADTEEADATMDEAATAIETLERERDELARASLSYGNQAATVTLKLNAAEAHVAKLRQIISECADAVGAGVAAPLASVEFLALVPGEVRLVVAKLKEALKPFVAHYDELYAKGYRDADYISGLKFVAFRRAREALKDTSP